MPTPWIVGSHRLTNAFEENLIEHVVLCLHAGGQQRVRVAVVGVRFWALRRHFARPADVRFCRERTLPSV
jgi:hypothetical protein